MADRGDTHYRVPNLNAWFAVSSLVFLVSCAWMVLDDFYRSWKVYQREFRDIEIARARAELASQEAQAIMAEEERLEEELEAVRVAFESQRAVLEELEEELRLLRGEQFEATEAAKVAKQEYNWERYVIEEHRLHHGDPDYRQEDLEAFEQRLYDAAGEQERADLAVAAKEAEIAELRSDVAAVEQRLKAAGKSLDLLRKQRASIDPEPWSATAIANVVRDDIPGLDFVSPSIQVNKVVLEDLTFELNFTKKKRIDMCMTCHVPIDREGFENEEHPHRSHPRLDLYLSAKSPHPMNEVGCTICHRGSGEALHFVRADHRPTDEAEGEEWYEEYHWHKQHHWDYPMLRSGDIEASCIQCHKDSMELIADDAPKVTEGYRNFERYGCYTCHKVDWFPTKRRPGPSLKHLAQKTTPEFVAAWIADPKAFRPTTWMPQIFHLENYAPEEEIVRSDYGAGRPILGQEWNDSAVAAVSAFVWSRSSDMDLDPVPVEGDAVRGAEVFRLSGCLACHNVAPYEGEPEVNDLALEPRGENEHGPNLRGVATKTNPTWLYNWIRQPHAYWSETRMPDLRLSEEDAADIVAYFFEDPDGFFTDVPEGWQVGDSPYDRDVLEEQARWLYSRDGRSVLSRRFETDWASDQALLEAVGEKLVLNQGCHSCHEISGLENAQPIGTELSSWGSKTVDKLDWGFVADQMAEEHGWSQGHKEEYKKYREGWLAQKLREPRSYDRGKEKNPTEKLRMPWFDFSQEEIASITTFVVGLVDDEVQRAKMVPTPGQSQMDHGLRVVRQKNCAACHVIEPGSITFEDEAGDVHTVRAELLAFEDEPLPIPMRDLESLREEVASFEEYIEEEVEEVGFRLLEPAPGVGPPAATVFVHPDEILDVQAPWGGGLVDLVNGYYIYGQELYDPEADEFYSITADPDGEGRVQDVDGEWRDYSSEPYDKVRWTFAPPVLWAEGHKVQKDWFYQFLVEPMPLREQIRVRMPSFRWDEGEAGAVADYFAHAAVHAWPSLFARELRLSLGLSIEELASRADIPASALADIEAGDKVATLANLPALETFATEVGFGMSPAVDPEHELVRRRIPGHLAEALAPVPGTDLNRIQLGEHIAREGPQCFQCHFYRGVPPLDGAAQPVAWAPDLDRVRERLREDWVEEWLWDPARKYPGTAMPANFSPDPDKVQYLDLYPDSSSADQIQAVLDWLYNTDRIYPEEMGTQ